MKSPSSAVSRINPRAALPLILVPLVLGCSSKNAASNPTDGTTEVTPTASPSAPPALTPTNTSQPAPAASQPPPAPDSPSAAPSASGAPTETPHSDSTNEATSDRPESAVSAPSGSTHSDDGSAAPGGEPTVMGNSFEINVQLASDVDDNAPTTVGIVTWTTTLPTLETAYVEFGLTTDYGMRAPVDLGADEHRTLLLGLKPSQTYHFRVVAGSSDALVASDDYALETGIETSAVSIGSFEVLDATQREPGYIVASYWSGADSAVAFILDQDGEIVWAYDTGMPGGIARAQISDDGKDMWIITASNNGESLQRVGIDGLGAQTYAANIGSHDITPVAGSTMAFIEYGEEDCDSIFEIEPSGQVKEVWESQDVQDSSSTARCHGNAVRYSAAEGVYTYSDVGTDIFQVTREGNLTWRLSETVPGGITAWGGSQHGHHLLHDRIVVFANRGAANAAASAVVEYALSDGAELWRYEGANDEASANLGDAQRLPGGNTLVTFSNDSVVHEVTPAKEVVLVLKGSPNTRIGYTEWRSSLYGPSPLLHD